MTARVLVGDCREVLLTLEANSIDACVCDPPYELSNDGKASAAGIALKFMFPEDTQIKTEAASEDCLPLLIQQILCLRRGGLLPRPSAAMPIGTVALNDDTAARDEEIEHSRECAVLSTNGNRRNESESQPTHDLGNFALKLTDPAALLNALNSAGCGFLAGGIGIGFRIGATGLPGFFEGGASVVRGDDDIGLRDCALSDLVGALSGATHLPVPRFDLGRRASETLSADGALVFCAVLLAGGAQLIRTRTGARRLPSMLEARRVRIVEPMTDRALSLNLVVHPQSIAANGFMGKSWDGSKVTYDVATWQAIYRVLKPGGHLLAFGSPRTSHRLTTAIEDAGFEVRDTLMFCFGSGFPKSLDVSKALDKVAGAEREVVGSRPIAYPDSDCWGTPNSKSSNRGIGSGPLYSEPGSNYEAGFGNGTPITAPVTDLARQWDGWGTALKPSYEPIVLARKPLAAPVVHANVTQYGTGALNIDGCRIKTDSTERDLGRVRSVESYATKSDGWRRPWMDESDAIIASEERRRASADTAVALGRWPANLLLDEESAALLDEMSGETKSPAPYQRNANSGNVNSYAPGIGEPFGKMSLNYGDTGGASRFFYTSKASRAERNKGLLGMPEQLAHRYGEKGQGPLPQQTPSNGVRERNYHPTVKPLDLMQWLVRLITPKGGTVLDCFAGSGSTGIAADREGFHFIGIEQDPEYAEIARKRIVGDCPLFTTLAAD